MPASKVIRRFGRIPAPRPAVALSAIALLGLGVPGAWAAKGLMTGADVRNGSLTGRDVKDGSLTGADLSGGLRDQIDGARTGPAGPAGAAGSAGAQGVRGDAGATGPAGPQGVRGEPGVEGDAGPQGDRGDTGLRGEAGPKGDTGPKGDAGPRGETGPKGDTGAAGAPALQLWADVTDARVRYDNDNFLRIRGVGLASQNPVVFDYPDSPNNGVYILNFASDVSACAVLVTRRFEKGNRASEMQEVKDLEAGGTAYVIPQSTPTKIGVRLLRRDGSSDVPPGGAFSERGSFYVALVCP